MRILRSNLVFISAFFLMFCGCAHQKPMQIRVLTYNIYHGANSAGKSNLDAVARVVRETGADLVAFQEVDEKTSRSGGVAITSVLAEKTGLAGRFGKAMDFAGGGYGEAVLSRFPIVATRNHLLPVEGQGVEPRAALEIVVALPNGEEIVFVGTHLDHLRDAANRKLQVERLGALFALDDGVPRIMVGDLNASPESDEIVMLLKGWSDADASAQSPTYPDVEPQKKIDYILFNPGNRWRVVKSTVLSEPGTSDHSPVFAILELLPPDLE